MVTEQLVKVAMTHLLIAILTYTKIVIAQSVIVIGIPKVIQAAA